jgi:hypothetical protein
MKMRLCFVFLLSVGAFVVGVAQAADTPDVAKKLVEKVPKDTTHQHPELYTGKHGFMNDADMRGGLEKGKYLMSWLVLDPPIVLGAAGGAASIGKDLYKDFVGIAETDVSSKNPKNYPRAGQKAKNVSQGIGKNGMWWIPVNFQDMTDSQTFLGTGGNEFDWKEWGFGGLDQFHEYLFALVKWNKGGKVTFTAGSDDPQQTWVDGVKTCEGLGDRDWAKDTDKGEATVPAGQWVPILAEVGENGGEAGYSLRIDPAPDDHTLDVDSVLAVEAAGKAPLTWGYLKTRR